jgi:protein disulfide-isomerase
MRLQWPPFLLIFCALVAGTARGQEAVHWHNDLESAKTMAKSSGRLVLVHFWTPSCGPCMALNQNVFNQPGVAGAIEQQFVPVKLNADENSATAQWFGITRVPTDVIITPDGQIVGKLISPPTPSAYVAELTATAAKHSSKGGQMFAKAAAAAPMQPQLNAAYANLNVSPNAQFAIAPPQQAAANATSSPVTPKPAGTIGQDRMALATPNAAAAKPQVGPAQTVAPSTPQVVTNPAANQVPNPYAAVTNVPPAQPTMPNTMRPVSAPNQIENRYAATTSSSPALPQQPVVPPTAATAAATTTPTGYESLLGRSAPTGAANVPPAAAGAAAGASMAAASGPGVAGAPDPRQLPTGSPPLGFEGYCPVTMRNAWKWSPGDPRWGVVHRGRTYWFAGPEEQKQFWTDPDRYTPALSGMDPVLAMDHQQQVPGKREHSLDYDGLFYMFASEATLQQFTANPQRYAATVRQAMGIPRGRLVR